MIARPRPAAARAHARTAAPRPTHRAQLACRCAGFPPRQSPPPPPQSSASSQGGFRLLENASSLVPQGAIVSAARAGWRLAWQTMVRELAPQRKDGAYVRPGYAFSARVGSASHPAVSGGRYALYAGNACPWCHRVLLALALRGMLAPSGERGVGGGGGGLVRVVQLLDDPERATRGGWIVAPPPANGGPRNGWASAAAPATEPVFGARDLYGVYEGVSPGFRGRCTAPLLVDASSRAAVCNESADLVRNLLELRAPAAAQSSGAGAPASSSSRPSSSSSPISSSSSSSLSPSSSPSPPSFSPWANAADLLPPQHRAEIERLNARVYVGLANGVYRAGFATSQGAYDEALCGARGCLAELEGLLKTRRFLCGDGLTEADVRLFPAVCRLDAVYHPFFLRGAPLAFCSPDEDEEGGGGASGGGEDHARVGGLAAVFPNLHAWMNDVWELPGVAATVDVAAVRASYWRNLFPLNPSGIVPPGPNEAAVRRGAGGEPGAAVAARRRRAFGAAEVVARAEEVCAAFSP